MNLEISSLLRRLPDWALLRLASLVKAPLRPLRPFPGWYFGFFEKEPLLPFIFKLRAQLVAVFAERRLRRPIRYDWYDKQKLDLYLGNDTSRPLFVGGCIEPNELAFVGSSLQPGMVMIDVGANEGLFTMLAARRVGDTGRVIAFEPNAVSSARLMENVRQNALRNVTVVKKAAADTPGVAELLVASYPHDGQHTLGGFVYEVDTAGTETVELCRIDDFVEEQALSRVDLIKIDVEGAETKVLRGSENTLRRFHPVLLLEIIDDSLRHQGSSASEVVAFLRACGYRLYGFSEKTGLPEQLNGELTPSNIIAAHELSRFALDRPTS